MLIITADGKRIMGHPLCWRCEGPLGGEDVRKRRSEGRSVIEMLASKIVPYK